MLGTGTSHGVPMIGCDCDVCRSTDSRDRRSRPSILIERMDRRCRSGPTFAPRFAHILVDTSTDLRMQALAHDVRRVDAILFTHSHADHILGPRRGAPLQRHAARAPIPATPTRGRWPICARRSRTFSTPTTPPGGGIPKIDADPDWRAVFAGRGRDRARARSCTGRRRSSGFRIGTVRVPDRLQRASRMLVAAARRRADARPRRAARAAAPDALHRRRGARGGRAASAPSAPISRTSATISAHAETCARLPRGVELAYDGLDSGDCAS